ncbi:MAG: rhodoquinone biosynthesis methyltransferase RquA [Rhodospirillales bacterium]
MDGGIDTSYASCDGSERPKLPDYLINTYTWAYLTPASIALLDNSLVVGSILWGNFRRLVNAACSEFEPGQRVLQAASVYGSFSADLAEVLGPHGRLDIVDIAPLQVDNSRRKLRNYPQVTVRLADAAAPGGGHCDSVCCFFLLHEVPDDHKRAVIDGLLAKVPPGGKAVFVDYHQPVLLHPLRMVMGAVFRWLEPYAQGLLDREIADFAGERDAFAWRKETYFGGLYQKVVAVREPVAAESRAAPE